MDAPSFLPLRNAQVEGLAAILRRVELHNLWDKINSYFSKIFPTRVSNSHICRLYVTKGGSAYYHHLLHCLKKDGDINFPLPNTSETCLYRYIWVSREIDLTSILSKGPLWYADENECRRGGMNYKPAIDYPDSLEHPYIFMSVESLPSKEIEKASGELETGSTFTKQTLIARSYRQKNISGRVIVQMPWRVPSDTSDLYIYCITNEDIWFYSSQRDINQAYHTFLHL